MERASSKPRVATSGARFFFISVGTFWIPLEREMCSPGKGPPGAVVEASGARQEYSVGTFFLDTGRRICSPGEGAGGPLGCPDFRPLRRRRLRCLRCLRCLRRLRAGAGAAGGVDSDTALCTFAAGSETALSGGVTGAPSSLTERASSKSRRCAAWKMSMNTFTIAEGKCLAHIPRLLLPWPRNLWD